MRTKNLLLHYMCVIEEYKNIFKDYGYKQGYVDDLINDLDDGLSQVYKLLCDDKLYYDESEIK